MGISDGIEYFISKLIKEADGEIEIRRNFLADHFGCSPSQINYVIQTRFTTERGYIVESRRGGSGFIRITKVSIPGGSLLEKIIQNIGPSLDLQTATHYIQRLEELDFISESVAKVMRAVISDNALGLPPPLNGKVRASLMKNMILSFLS